ncbi:DUF6233 domain-containing protein [Streptomyces sp. NPDC048197]|uniref:DUF6233 domain-containing protein n=1 Tax=Streptomyces sp. NPDC048197 TaxID=3365511 RepID=UPI00371D2A7C
MPCRRRDTRHYSHCEADGRADAYLHRRDCAQAASTGGTVSDEEALSALAGPDVTVSCPVCRPTPS